MTVESIITEARKQILSCQHPDEVAEGLAAAREICGDALTAISKAQDELEQLANFMRAALTSGDVYTVPAHVAAWVARARNAGDQMRPALGCGLVADYDGRLWLMCSDGYRLHAHAVDGVPPGIYHLADSQLAKADVKPIDFVEVIDRILPVGPLPAPVLAHHALMDQDTAAWQIDGSQLVTAKYAECNYYIDRRYWLDAASVSQDAPAYAYPGKLKPHSKLHLRWGDDVLAVIMPLAKPG